MKYPRPGITSIRFSSNSFLYFLEESKQLTIGLEKAISNSALIQIDTIFGIALAELH